jgi:hypothetical protein
LADRTQANFLTATGAVQTILADLLPVNALDKGEHPITDAVVDFFERVPRRALEYRVDDLETRLSRSGKVTLNFLVDEFIEESIERLSQEAGAGEGEEQGDDPTIALPSSGGVQPPTMVQGSSTSVTTPPNKRRRKRQSEAESLLEPFAPTITRSASGASSASRARSVSRRNRGRGNK